MTVQELIDKVNEQDDKIDNFRLITEKLINQNAGAQQESKIKLSLENIHFAYKQIKGQLENPLQEPTMKEDSN